MIFFRLIFQTVFLALGQIWVNKVRSILTTLGIIIGVAAVVAIVSATDGMRLYILNEFETFGAKKVFIDGHVPRSKWGLVPWQYYDLKKPEIEAILKNADSIDKITPMVRLAGEVRAGELMKNDVSVFGIWPTWHEIENRTVIQGRPFSRIDEDEMLAVCLINDKCIEEFNLPKEPLDQFITIKARRFRVVGVVETKDLGPMFGGGDTRSEVFVPASVAMAANPNGWINYAVAQLKSPDRAEEAVQEIKFILRKMRNMKPEDEETFDVEVLQQIIDQFNSMAGAITAIAGGIVGISLVVGGVGIMNIMLVSVSERTREIGLRKAVGANPAVILMQFLVEAVALCVVGGAVGLVVAQGAVFGLQQIDALKNAGIPVWAVVLSVAFSAATGVVFGMFPAIKAARLDPIDALRHE
ncbi:MAG: ABC transporter permease [Phycisphaerales bacterium]